MNRVKDPNLRGKIPIARDLERGDIRRNSPPAILDRNRIGGADPDRRRHLRAYRQNTHREGGNESKQIETAVFHTYNGFWIYADNQTSAGAISNGPILYNRNCLQTLQFTPVKKEFDKAPLSAEICL